MSVNRLVRSIDITKIKSPSGLTYGQELVKAANLLRDCIQSRINRETMSDCISTSDLADIKVSDGMVTITLKIQNAKRPSIFNEKNHKFANVFWLINDGFVVQKDWYFDGFPHKERWVNRKAEHFVEKGIEDFNQRTTLPVQIKLIKRPEKYYWEE